MRAIAGNVRTGFGVRDGVNVNGDLCDCYYYIFLNPEFVNTADYDFYLLESSRCIDAGDRIFPYDPDNTITDIGRYYFNSASNREELSAFPFTKGILGVSPNPCTGVLAVSFSVPGQMGADIRYSTSMAGSWRRSIASGAQAVCITTLRVSPPASTSAGCSQAAG